MTQENTLQRGTARHNTPQHKMAVQRCTSWHAKVTWQNDVEMSICWSSLDELCAAVKHGNNSWHEVNKHDVMLATREGFY